MSYQSAYQSSNKKVYVVAVLISLFLTGIVLVFGDTIAKSLVNASDSKDNSATVTENAENSAVANDPVVVAKEGKVQLKINDDQQGKADLLLNMKEEVELTAFELYFDTLGDIKIKSVSCVAEIKCMTATVTDNKVALVFLQDINTANQKYPSGELKIAEIVYEPTTSGQLLLDSKQDSAIVSSSEDKSLLGEFSPIFPLGKVATLDKRNDSQGGN